MHYKKFLIVFLLMAALAYAIPPLPEKFSGSVTLDNAQAPINTEIRIYVNNAYKESYSLEEAGVYSLYVKDGDIGNKVEFKISNQTAGTSTRKGGAKTDLNLAVYADRDNDGVNDTDDKLIGKGSDIDSNYNSPLIAFIDQSDNLSLALSGIHAVEIKSNNETVLSFNYDFNAPLNFYNLKLKKERNDVGSLIISGISLPEGQTKSVKIDKLNSSSKNVCIKDIELDSAASISSKCNGTNETIVYCDGIAHSGFTCTDSGSKYTITGLKHSGLLEYTCAEQWSCSDWSSCSNNEQSRSCTDNNACGTQIGKPALSQSCSSCSGNSGGGGGGGGGGGSSGGSATSQNNVPKEEPAPAAPSNVKEQKAESSTNNAESKKEAKKDNGPQQTPKQDIVSIPTTNQNKGFFQNIFTAVGNFFSGGNKVTGAVVGAGEDSGIKPVVGLVIVAVIAGLCLIIAVFLKKKKKSLNNN